jgi:aspartyl-tRNA(Asn)/glutamyl-tRNA(Gln) amidotransferase subunit C
MSSGTPDNAGAGGAVDLSEGAVRKVARLSRLALDDAAIRRSGEQLRAVLGYIDRLRELDLTGVEPMAHPLDVANRLDPDETRAPLPTSVLLKMAPETAGPFVKVPKVLGEEGGA